MLRCAKPALRLRAALGVSGRVLSTAALPMEPPIAMFGIAGRYANALYSAAAKKGALLEVEQDLKLVKETVATSTVLRSFASDPSIPRAAKMAGVAKLMESAKASETTKNVMLSMAEGGRMGELTKVIDMYSELMAAAKGELTAVITSPSELKPAEIDEIKAKISKMMGGGTVTKTSVKVNPGLLGGYTVVVGDRFFDNSVATQFSKLAGLLHEEPQPRMSFADFVGKMKDINEKTKTAVETVLAGKAVEPHGPALTDSEMAKQWTAGQALVKEAKGKIAGVTQAQKDAAIKDMKEAASQLATV